jgi:hypothetical protein
MNLGAAALFLATLRDQPTGGPYSPSAGECGVTDGSPSPSVGRRGEACPPQLALVRPGSDSGSESESAVVTAVASPPQLRLVPLGRPSRGWKLSQPFVYLGRISYGLYVFHVLGLMISDYAIPHQGASLGRFLYRDAVGFAITVALSAISFRWLETPFLNLKQRFTHILSRPGG